MDPARPLGGQAPARATDIEAAPVAGDEGLSLAVLGLVCAAPLPALAALLYGLGRARRSANRPDPPVNFSAADRQGLINTTEHRTMRRREFPTAAMLIGGTASVAQQPGPACVSSLDSRAGERVLASLPR